MNQDHPDRLRWNARYEAEEPSFEPHPLVAEALEAGFPLGPVLELACGRSGSALALAAAGRLVVAVDVSDVALAQLAREAEQRRLADRIRCVAADAHAFEPDEDRFALVLSTYFWDEPAFRSACRAVAPGGLIGWEALTGTRDGTGGHRTWFVEHGGLSARLPADFDVLIEEAQMSPRHRTERVLARRR